MSDGNDIQLDGLEGTNPLGFFAAIGATTALNDRGVRATLRWSQGPIPVARIEGPAHLDELLDVLAADLAERRTASILSGEVADVKVPGDDIGGFVGRFLDADPFSRDLVQALVVEGSVDNNGVSKPSDFHFTAGQQAWLTMAGKVAAQVSTDDIERAARGPWTYESKLPSLMWDTADDRVYALSATNPAKDTKLTEPGAEWLALIGLASFPVIAGRRTMTPGCSGNWKGGTFSWPLWDRPLRPSTIRSLVASRAALDHDAAAANSLGVTHLLQSDIRRSDQGGYGTFGPPTTIWQRPMVNSAG